MGDIILDPKKGVNPYMTYCTYCVRFRGKSLDAVKKEDRPNDGRELILVGNRQFVDTCTNCGMQYFGGKPAPKQPYEGTPCIKCSNTSYTRRRLTDYERIPSAEPCEECQKIIDEEKAHMTEVVGAGGIYFLCEDCGTQAVITADHELAKEVRKKMKIEPPHPCGVKVTKKDCPMCRTEN